MQVILLKDVKGLGRAGEVAKVSDGHARNYLIPKKLAMEANAANLRILERKKAEIEAQRELDKSVAEDIKAKLEAASIKLTAKAGENGRLFGAVTSKDIADAIERDFKITLDKKKIELENPIKQAGACDVVLKLFPGVNAKIKLEVEAI